MDQLDITVRVIEATRADAESFGVALRDAGIEMTPEATAAMTRLIASTMAAASNAAAEDTARQIVSHLREHGVNLNVVVGASMIVP